MSVGSLTPCHALWIGSRLSPIAEASLASFIKAGHPVILHSYDSVGAVPPGVECADANAVVPRDRLFVHADTGSYSMFSNYFRYQVLKRALGLYIDCDVVCVRAVDADRTHVFGWQDAEVINGAVLKLPSGSRVLRDLNALFERSVFAPPWYSLKQRGKQHVKPWLNRPADIAHAPWGSGGPTAITWYVRRHRLVDQAQAPTVFYPVHWRDAGAFLQPSRSWNEWITDETRCVHLWNETLRHHAVGDAPKGSPLRAVLDGHWP